MADYPVVADVSRLLPVDLAMAGWQLLAFTPMQRPDPLVLYNPWGEIVAQWEQEPSLTELWGSADCVRSVERGEAK